MRQAEAENYWLNASNCWLNSSNCWLVARRKKKVWPHPVLGAEPNLMEKYRGGLCVRSRVLAVGNVGSCSELDFPHILAV